jgi:hypothetical protein
MGTSKRLVLEVFPYNPFAFRFPVHYKQKGGEDWFAGFAASDMSLAPSARPPKNAFRFMTQKNE